MFKQLNARAHWSMGGITSRVVHDCKKCNMHAQLWAHLPTYEPTKSHLIKRHFHP